MSPQPIRSPELVEQLRQSLEVRLLDPSLVVLEITESVLARDESGADDLAPLRELGVLIAINDFGIGSCSLSSLQRFPVDIVKIDRQFIEEIDDHPGTMSLARMILQLTAGLDVGQGYLLSGPLEGAELGRRFGVAECRPHEMSSSVKTSSA